jgi:CBS domain-containing protein
MAVFFVHDVNHGIVKPLDRKFRVREINPVQEVSSSQAIHPKTSSDLSDFQTIHSNTNKEQANQQQKQPFENTQKAIQAYQENIPASPKLSLGKVKDIMSQPIITCFQDQTLEAAWRLMQEYGIHHLIILDDAQHYCGMLSEKLILPYLMSYAQKPQNRLSPSELRLSHFCDQDLLSTHPETELHDLGVAMMEYGLDAVAVSENTKIIGIVTKSDIFKVILKQQTFKELA